MAIAPDNKQKHRCIAFLGLIEWMVSRTHGGGVRGEGFGGGQL